MPKFEVELARRLKSLEEQNLFRHLRQVDSPQGRLVRIEGRELLNFSSNDYLGLANHPKLKEAAVIATQKHGVGSGASRLVCGSLQPHHGLEECLACFKQTEAALVFSSGYSTALGAITALVGSHDIIILDKLVHASIVDAARLSGAKLRIYAHNDLNDLEAILQWCDRQRASSSKHVLIVTESLFSMDGDIAPLPRIVELKEKYGAWLMVDEAHATGLFGERRTGLSEQFRISDQVEVQMGTLGKAIGSAGGYIAGSRTLIDYLINQARSFVFSTAPPPSVSAAAQAGLELIQSTEGAQRLATLRSNISLFAELSGATAPAANSPIVPWTVGEEMAALQLAENLRARGLFVPAIRYPTVARGKARLRITFSTAHTLHDLKHLVEALKAQNDSEPERK